MSRAQSSLLHSACHHTVRTVSYPDINRGHRSQSLQGYSNSLEVTFSRDFPKLILGFSPISRCFSYDITVIGDYVILRSSKRKAVVLPFLNFDFLFFNLVTEGHAYPVRSPRFRTSVLEQG